MNRSIEEHRAYLLTQCTKKIEKSTKGGFMNRDNKYKEITTLQTIGSATLGMITGVIIIILFL